MAAGHRPHACMLRSHPTPFLPWPVSREGPEGMASGEPFRDCKLESLIEHACKG